MPRRSRPDAGADQVPVEPAPANGVVIGVVGGQWRGRVTPWGAVVPADGSPTLEWWVAAEDRWHTPAREPSVRQRVVDGVPVVETAVRVPGGDVVETVYAVADGGGFTVVELENRSPVGVAVALSRRDLVTSRPPASVPVQGVDAPADALVVPIGHRTSVRVALPHGAAGGIRPAELAPPDAVVRGWLAQVAHGVDLRLPDAAPRIDVTTLRCAVLLEGPPSAETGPAHLIGVAELGRLGEPVEPWLDDAIVVAEGIGRTARRSGRVAWSDDAALLATREVLGRAGHSRGADDVADLRRRLPAAGATPEEPPAGVLGLAWAERRLVVAGPAVTVLDLLPAPFPASWAGQAVEAYGIPVGGDHAATIGLALRWHGERPALLWEVAGPPVTLSSSGLDPSWSREAARGEALLSPRPVPG